MYNTAHRTKFIQDITANYTIKLFVKNFTNMVAILLFTLINETHFVKIYIYCLF